MFEVKSLGQNNPNKITLLNGLTFGFIGLPLFFEVRHEKIETNLLVEFTVNNDEKKKSNEFVANKIENNVLKLYYYNPSIGTSGLVQPISIVQLDSELFALIFYIDYLKNSETYRLTYEFYHGQLPKSI